MPFLRAVCQYWICDHNLQDEIVTKDCGPIAAIHPAAIVKGTIGFKDVMDAFAKGCYKACPGAFKEHASSRKTLFDLG